jgi:hypothetical protein
MVKGNNPTGPHSYSGGIGSSTNNGSSTPGSVGSGGDFSQIDFSLDIGRVNEGEDLRTTVMVGLYIDIYMYIYNRIIRTKQVTYLSIGKNVRN